VVGGGGGKRAGGGGGGRWDRERHGGGMWKSMQTPTIEPCW